MSEINHEARPAIAAGLNDLQEIVYKSQRNLPMSFVQLDAKSHEEFCEQAEADINAKLQTSTDVYAGMSLIARGNGAFRIKPRGEKKLMMVQRIVEGNVLQGIIARPKVIAIPPLSRVLERQPSTLEDLQVAVLLQLTSALFRNSDGLYQLDSACSTFISLTYPGLTYDRGVLIKPE